MTLKIKTADIELEYTDEYKIIEGQAKQHILDIINKIHEHQVNSKSFISEEYIISVEKFIPKREY